MAAELVAVDDAGGQGFGADEGLTHAATVAGGGDTVGRVSRSRRRHLWMNRALCRTLR